MNHQERRRIPMASLFRPWSDGRRRRPLRVLRARPSAGVPDLWKSGVAGKVVASCFDDEVSVAKLVEDIVGNGYDQGRRVYMAIRLCRSSAKPRTTSNWPPHRSTPTTRPAAGRRRLSPPLRRRARRVIFSEPRRTQTPVDAGDSTLAESVDPIQIRAPRCHAPRCPELPATVGVSAWSGTLVVSTSCRCSALVGRFPAIAGGCFRQRARWGARSPQAGLFSVRARR